MNYVVYIYTADQVDPIKAFNFDNVHDADECFNKHMGQRNNVTMNAWHPVDPGYMVTVRRSESGSSESGLLLA